jgi:F0F1-type ATP synthase assembly protein I
LRDFSQTLKMRHVDGKDKREGLPEIPEIPELPAAPELKPNLPKLERRKLGEGAENYRNMGIAYTIPAALIAPILVLTLGGWWLDARLHKSPFFTLCGAVLGAICGFINMIRMANKLNE